ncbi:MAG TPA: fibronectin type III domain-containing protein [Bacteroidales bacterium]|nr:fibronectin type III domain-containing protein [Bacteroidales bacterium]HSA42282.1 fibronectin type III domain-containing protein [Bacteroidales bacterium]
MKSGAITSFILAVLTVTLAGLHTARSQNTCPAPAGLTVSGITATSAHLSWNPTGATAYQLSYCPAGYPSWQSFTVTTPGKTIQGLMPNTQYSWLVRSVCAGPATNLMNTGPWSVIGYFTTLAPQPACHASFVFTMLPNPTPATGFGVQFTSTSTGVNNTTQYLWDFGDGFSATQQHPVHYYYQAGTYTVCLAITTLFSNNTSLTCTDTFCQTIVIPPLNTCPVPVNLTAFNLTDHSATLEWSATGAVKYQVRYRKLMTNANSPWITLNALVNTLSLNNLLPASPYEWQVRAFCGSSSNTLVISPWSPSSLFNTLASPVNPVLYGQEFEYYCEGTASAVAGLEVFDLTGMLVYNAMVNLQPGINTIDLSAPALRNGIYLIRINEGSQGKTMKISIVR